ncbi:type I-E CRISPR-associated endoribonuclease Cas2e [Phytoactinopolyspora limicola]|uniref:type I-E CRISPR-associated endoribonuclease Cas2e n=1 Tax=Phytoactinopolyspora limicola TaxID=2715536 RepID=UPI00140E6D0D|nr:type I-E CRISPR-associated endoribonuclease Cas2e [Phytoactinopolyspora limicola]
MTVVILTAVPPGLRGHLTRWLLEISPGVFVGYISARVREHMWERVVEFVSGGRALMVHSVRGEQRLAFEVHGHDWEPIDYDGITLMRRSTVPDYVPAPTAPIRKTGAGAPSEDVVWRRRNARKKFRKKEEKRGDGG